MDVVASQATSHSHRVLKVLGALKEASHQLQQTNSLDSSCGPVKALLELEFASKSILSFDRQLSTLSSLLSDLKSLIQSLDNSKPKQGLRSFLTNRVRAHAISRVASSIESEIQAWIDREKTANLTKTLYEWSGRDEESLFTQLSQFRNRLAQGFDIDLQDTLLKSRILPQLETLLCRTDVSKRVREMVAYSLKEVVLFNKDVFIGEVRVGQTIKALVSMGSFCALEVLKSLIKAIKSPLVDELESCGGISKIISVLDSADLPNKIMAIDCLMEIGYYGRKEAIEAMLNEGLIKRLVYLQRSELVNDPLDKGKGTSGECGGESAGRGANAGGVEKTGRRKMNASEGHGHLFDSVVARFAAQLEAGEGLRQREKRAFKQEILKRIREASVSEAEAATVIAEVLWGSSP